MTPTRRRRNRQAALLAAAVALLLPAGCTSVSNPHAQGTAGADRQAEVAQRGATVMPFDLDRTTHRFTKSPTGGVQSVVADDPADATQIGRI
jgi:hypothetical protein